MSAFSDMFTKQLDAATKNERSRILGMVREQIAVCERNAESYAQSGSGHAESVCRAQANALRKLVVNIESLGDDR